MKLLDIHKRAKQLLTMFTSVKDAWDYYDAQKNAIKNLRTTEWYKHLVQFFETEAEEAMQELRDWKTLPSDTPNVKARVNMALKYLDRLDNMTA